MQLVLMPIVAAPGKRDYLVIGYRVVLRALMQRFHIVGNVGTRVGIPYGSLKRRRDDVNLELFSLRCLLVCILVVRVGLMPM